jgi:hypothetical protein
VTLPSGPFPGVPTPSQTSIDRTRRNEGEQDEQRQAMFGVARSADTKGNVVVGSDFGGQGWGLSLPHIHEPCYPMTPYLGTAGYALLVAYCATFVPLAQQVNVGVRWAVVESVVTNTAVGEFEMRWNRGKLPAGRGTGPNDSLLLDSWNSGTPGTKGVGGELIRSTSFLWPADGPQPVVYRDTQWVTVSVWAYLRAATGGAADIAKVAPAWCYQSGVGQA